MDKIRFAIIGTNFISSWMINGARQDERFCLKAIYSRTRERGEEFAKQWDIPLVFTDLEQMASSDEIDAVYIASPNYAHCQQAVLCMQHGKHVLCEKPFASNAAEVRKMIAASQKYGVALMEAMKSTLAPSFTTLREHLQRIGTPRAYLASFCQYSSRYDKYKAGIPVNAFDPKLSNGALMDVGVYTLYPLVLLFGRPQSISAQATFLESGADAQGSVCLQYEGMNAVLRYSKIANSYLPAEIQGEQGNLIIDRIQTPGQIRFIPRPAPASGHEKREEGEIIAQLPPKDEYYYVMAEFIDVIQSGALESKTNSHTTSLLVSEILDQIRSIIGLQYPADL